MLHAKFHENRPTGSGEEDFSDLKVGRCRQLIEFMKVCEY